MGMQSGTATLEDSLVVSYQIAHSWLVGASSYNLKVTGSITGQGPNCELNPELGQVQETADW